METKQIDLCPVDKAEVLILSDNHSDVLLPSGDSVQRPSLAKEGVIPTDTLLAEHGLSLLITVETGGDSRSVLLDSGYTDIAVPHNLDYLGIGLENIEAVVLSHGHMDHFGALEQVIKRGPAGIELVLHPDVFNPRALDIPTGDTLFFPPFPSKETLSEWGARVVENQGPLLLADEQILVTGEVDRSTPFEKGFPGAKAREGKEFVLDNFRDDQSLVIHVKDKGLAVISGCAHSGIINSIHQARRLTGVEDVFAVIGGFHLSGPAMAPAVAPTIEALEQMSMSLVCPMHCSGFTAVSALSQALPDSFVLSSVGSKIIL
ncbi:MBL fold metallo-hydrolase [Desulfospira joergensenii]|uniref:MBL fold metallo-hydrolase n=1 Tax=Desulfospira joergensenii TaxID=53329 RepID=UPI0003B5F199|nr:MBL fold metallo-hydrolase [Desulfospira joergensenii]